jgi:hypothetical protein
MVHRLRDELTSEAIAMGTPGDALGKVPKRLPIDVEALEQLRRAAGGATARAERPRRITPAADDDGRIYFVPTPSDN